MWSRIAVPAIEPILTDQPMEDLEALPRCLAKTSWLNVGIPE